MQRFAELTKSWRKLATIICRPTQKAVASPDVRERFTAVGADAYSTSPREFAELVRADVER